jgi:hypothetical protein
MGTTPEGKVFYGFALVDEDGEPLGDIVPSNWEETYIKEQGGLPRPEENNYRSPEWDEWRAKRHAMIAACPVDTELIGYDDYLATCVVIRESFAKAEWGEVVPLKTLETKAEWEQQLRDWCNMLGVPYRQPGWYVASLYF